MSNIRSLSDMKKDPPGGGRGGGAPQGGGAPGGNPLSGLFGGLFGGGGSGGGGGNAPSHQNEGKSRYIRDGTLKDELNKAGGKLVVVDFTASWCGPCKGIAPYFSQLSEKYTNVVFLKVDVDECPQTASECGIKAMPTFHFYKNKSKVDEFSGASQDKLRDCIERHQTAGGASESTGFTSGGNVLGGSSTGPKYGEGRVLGSAPTSSSSNTQESGVVQANESSTPQEMNLVLVATLVDMGFPQSLAQKALKAHPGNIEAAADWCVSHIDEASSDAPVDSTSSSSGNQSSSVSDGMDIDDDGFQKSGPKFDDRHLTEEELVEEKRILQEKLAKRREQKAEEEKNRAIENEKLRIIGGKNAQEVKKKFDEDQRQRDEFLKKKLADEDKVAKQKIKDKIAQDKAERAAASKKLGNENTPVTTTPVTTAAPVVVKKDYTECSIQVRLTNGNVIKASFKPTDTVRTVHDHIAMLTNNDRFTLVTTFPRKTYSTKDSSADVTLLKAECVPSGTFIVSQ